jgi:hypothetical protein
MKLKDTVVVTAAGSLVMVVIVMMVMFIIALLDPQVDDGAIFTIIGPAFQTIVGGFIGLITGINIKGADDNESE